MSDIDISGYGPATVQREGWAITLTVTDRVDEEFTPDRAEVTLSAAESRELRKALKRAERSLAKDRL